jgi:L-fuculose-phosphate aldolase
LSEVGEQIIKAIKELVEQKILFAKGGNLSARYDNDQVIVTSSGKDYSTVKADDLVITDYEGKIIKGEKKPSSELPLHLAIYKRRPDVQSIIHTHAIWPYILSVCHRNLPAVSDEFTILLGGEIKVSEYKFPGTKNLGDSVADVLGMNNAALIANHGCVTVGRSVEEALENMVVLANFSKIYVLGSIFGKVYPLPDWAIEKEKELYKKMFGQK